MAEGGEKDKAQEELLISSEDIKVVVKDAMQAVLEETENVQYDHVKSAHWVNRICEICLAKLTAKRKPYKFIVNALIMRKTGAGLHVCSSAFWGQNDSSVCEAYDGSKFICAVVTVHWLAI